MGARDGGETAVAALEARLSRRRYKSVASTAETLLRDKGLDDAQAWLERSGERGAFEPKPAAAPGSKIAGF